MSRRLISTGSPFEKTAGYSRVVIDGDFAFVAGTTGYDYATMTMPADVTSQTRNCFKTIEAALKEAGFAMADIVRATYYITDGRDADAHFAVCGEVLGDIRPAATLLVVAGLYKPEMKVEIEVTAKRRSPLIPHPISLFASLFPVPETHPMSPPDQLIHAKISGPIVMIGFGSIGKGTLPLIERHFDYDKSRFVIIDPHEDGELAKKHGVRFIKQGVTRDNYRDVLVPLLTAGGGQGFCVNLSVDTSSVDIMTLCREIGALYIDTVVEPWLGFYFDKNIGPEKRSNYALRETLLAAKRQQPGRPDRGLHLWRQSRHGVLVRQAGAARHRPRHQHAVQRAEEPRRLGPARPQARRQGHPYRRTRHPALEESEADGRVRQHLVGRGLCLRRHAAGRTRLGHP